jgi:hypothetical protein
LRRAISIALLLAVLLSAFFVPYDLAFLHNEKSAHEELMRAAYVVLDAAYLVDFLAHFVTAYRNFSGTGDLAWCCIQELCIINSGRGRHVVLP